jgi:uncharacterized phiE125 gp8 family phage protein
MAAIKLTTAPTVECVTAADIRAQGRITDTSEDTLLAQYGKAARIWCEDYTGRSFVTTVWTYTLDYFCGNMIVLPRAPLQSVTSLKYYDAAGSQQTWAGTNYTADTARFPGCIHLGYNKTWPATYAIPNAIEVVYKAGYGDAATSVPENILQAIRLLACHWYENREASIPTIQIGPIPFGVEVLLGGEKVWMPTFGENAD